MRLTHIIFCFLILPFLAKVAVHGNEIPRVSEPKSSEAEPILIQATIFDPQNPDDAMAKQFAAHMALHPGVKITQWGSLYLPGPGGQATRLLAVAGGVAPDISDSWFHALNNNIQKGMLYPLNEWIGDDTNGDGRIDDSEAKWPGWKKIDPLWRSVATQQGKVYGVPGLKKNYLGIVFRTDLARAAGLNPNRPPQTWEEFYYWCQKLTIPGKSIPGAVNQAGQRGLNLQGDGYLWLPWVQAAGGEPIVQIRTSPTTGEDHVFGMQATDFRTASGEDLQTVPPTWRANFASDEALAAAAFYHRMRWAKWMLDPETREPLALTTADLAAGFVMVGERRVPVVADSVITGVLRNDVRSRGANQFDPLTLGEAAMKVAVVSELIGEAGTLKLDPALLSWFPFPAGPGPNARRVVQVQNHYTVLFEGVGKRPTSERDAIWEVMKLARNPDVVRDGVKFDVVSGMARFVPTKLLREHGFSDYIKDVPPAIRRNWEEIESGEVQGFVEPFMGFWYSMDVALRQEVLSLILATTGENFDFSAALRKVEGDANGGIMFGLPPETLDKYRPYARIGFGLTALGFLAVTAVMLKGFLSQQRDAAARSSYKFMPWLIIAPALLLVALWGYYPLVRGMFMAFQDYKIAGDSPFVGLDNFITLFLDKSWWMSIWRTVVFVVLSMALGFTAPIVLALLLSEVPRGKVFFRTLFFLPQVTSGLVIILLWRLMYEPTPEGFFNQMLALINHLPLVNIEPQVWLEDPRLAMVCVILPGIWAGTGMGSLIYLAALKGVPEECYEAAELDGANLWHKIRNVTLPTIFPLILINFVGAFIGTFQSMGNILLLTFGGPGQSTTVAGMRIWMEAYGNIRFSMATAMAWTLGSMLIGFTYMQIRILRRVEFRRANWG